MNSFIDDHQTDFENILNHLRQEVSAIRTGRASPVLVEKIMVDAYGAKSPLIQLAGITATDSRTILIEPWDKNVIKEIEKAVNESGLGLNAVNEGRHLRISIPSLTEESRRDLLKMLNQKAEDSRQTLRVLRDDVKSEIQQAEKDKAMGEDEKFRWQKKLDEVTGEYNERIKGLVEKKEKEIMTI
ncbi:MAG: ribosome recycling factor [bacterium]